MSSIAPSENCDSNPPSRLQHFSDPGHASTPRTVDRGAIIDACTELARAGCPAVVYWFGCRLR